MSSRTVLVSLVLVLTSLFLTGCGGEHVSSDSTPTSPTRTGASLPRAGAPDVTQPLETTSAESAPCDLISQADVEAVGGGTVERRRVDELSSAKVCAWVFADRFGVLTAGMNTGETDGLSHLYSLKAQGSGLTTFNPVAPIEGYPAVVFANGGERSYVCNLAVGVRNDLMYTVIATPDTSSPHRTDPCGLATKLATLAIQQLKKTH